MTETVLDQAVECRSLMKQAEAAVQQLENSMTHLALQGFSVSMGECSISFYMLSNEERGRILSFMLDMLRARYSELQSEFQELGVIMGEKQQ